MRNGAREMALWLSAWWTRVRARVWIPRTQADVRRARKPSYNCSFWKEKTEISRTSLLAGLAIEPVLGLTGTSIQ